MEDINKLWLPLVVYTNTDQQKTTRLGENWEWSTKMLVKREGQFGFEVLDGPRSSKEVRTTSQCIHTLISSSALSTNWKTIPLTTQESK